MLVSFLDVNAGFTLTDPKDSRYQKVAAYRLRYGHICQRAASALRQKTGGEDRIDAVMVVIRAIDQYLLGYALSRGDFDSLQKNYDQARDANRFWLKQRENSRLVFLKRAQVYHSGRQYMHALYRRRSALDDSLLDELYYVRSTRYTLPVLFDALTKGSDPDRMKGALYVLWNKGIAAYALGGKTWDSTTVIYSPCSVANTRKSLYFVRQPSVQKLVNNLAQDCLGHLTEESIHTDAYMLSTPGVEAALDDLIPEFSVRLVDQQFLKEALDKKSVRISMRSTIYNNTVASILEVAMRPTTHWRYVQMASRFLAGLIRRDVPTSPGVARFFAEQSLSPQPTIRLTVQK
ncbi:hypothetical protein H0H81_006970 [Sphagnurus paluster]|uniref:Uncharacterized protein n=1 Tax=Sphagnurus paluster TaxID=117069 RepID=A0A9P7K6F1_9AGAR|nr:hypothetical protein H0H81_006970 [Sphagnurus paluster]